MRITRDTKTIRLGPNFLRERNELEAQGYTRLWAGEGQLCMEAPEPGTPLPEPKEVVVNQPGPCSRCNGTRQVASERSVRLCLAYGDPMESVACPKCQAVPPEADWTRSANWNALLHALCLAELDLDSINDFMWMGEKTPGVHMYKNRDTRNYAHLTGTETRDEALTALAHAYSVTEKWKDRPVRTVQPAVEEQPA